LGIEPHAAPTALQVVGVQPPLHTLASQVWAAPQLPQFKVSAQPSETAPQFLPNSAQVFAVQVPTPHTLATPPPPQVKPPAHVAQFRVAPQPSLTVPHCAA
jgi:hypothetical protein